MKGPSAIGRLAFTCIALLLFGALAGCSLPGTQNPHACADLVASSMSSPDHPVAGAFACYASNIQSTFRTYGATNDIALQRGAQLQPVYRSYRYVGVTANAGFIYELRGDQATDAVVVLWTASDGRVEQVSSMAKPQIAPPPGG